jgi:diacylglycerol diphosphate phosphatase/phosphatidate phosphatase
LLIHVSIDHWHDVLVGSLIGTLFSFFSYRQYFPDLSSPLSHRPYSPRIKREEADVLPTYNTTTDNNNTGQNPTDPSKPHPDTYSVEEAYELEGTVPRPEPVPLTEVWRDGEGDPADHAREEREALSPALHEGSPEPPANLHDSGHGSVLTKVELL